MFSCQWLRILLSSGIWLHIFCCNLQLWNNTHALYFEQFNLLPWKWRQYVPPKQWQITTRIHRITAQRMVLFNTEEMSKKWCQDLWQNSKKEIAISTKGKRSLKWLLKHWKVLLVLNFPCNENVIIVCKLAYLQDTLKIAINVTRLKEILKWNEDCMNGVNEYMYLITSSKHHWHFMQQNTQIFRT